ncbi:hypothetical protein ZWY2020_057039 [Hordeum vulgare]|nr:hypothetical protein ZWY2020_057039 [Hordeum vulgare]
MAEPNRSRTPAPRQPSPAGSSFTWLIPRPAASQATSCGGPASARSLFGLRRRLLSIHYPISSPRYAPAPRTCSQMWPKLVAEAKDDGPDCIETYFLKLDKGIVSGINAARHSDGKPLIVLERESSYIGTLIDDLVTKDLREPYPYID